MIKKPIRFFARGKQVKQKRNELRKEIFPKRHYNVCIAAVGPLMTKNTAQRVAMLTRALAGQMWQ